MLQAKPEIKSLLSDFGFYLLRSPLLPIESIWTFLSMQSRDEIRTYLKNLYATQPVKEAILLSSPDLFLEVEKWLAGQQEASDKLIKTLYKYTIRMGTRCTPYGGFAGISMGHIVQTAEKTSMICRNNSNEVVYRLDMQYLSTIAQHLSLDKEIKPRLSYFPNHTIYRQGEYYKFYQQKSLNGNDTHLSTVRATPVLDLALTKAQEGCTYQQLTVALSAYGSTAQAASFIDRLIQQRLLVSMLTPTITGEDSFTVLRKKLEVLDEEKKYLPGLEEIDRLLVSKTPLWEKEQKIQTLLAQKFPDITYKNLLQGDLRIGMNKNEIEKKSMDRLTKQLGELIPLAVQRPITPLDQFKKEFSDRYDGQCVPLLDVLDPDTGIGYGSNSHAHIQNDELLKDLEVQLHNPPHTLVAHDYQDLVLEKYLDSIKHGLSEIVLTADDLHHIGKARTPAPGLPPSCYAIGSLHLSHREDREELLFHLQGYGGTSAGNLIARFGHLDKDLRTGLQDIARAEQAHMNNSLAAEIVHLPEARTGNILQRPGIRQAEIVLMGQVRTGTTPIAVHDLQLFMQGDHLVLWSKKLQKEIVPYLTSAHNFGDGINLYRFLADLQSQHHRFDVRWDWGILKKQCALPRVRYKDIILCRARWHIRQLTQKAKTAKEEAAIVQNLQKEHGLPRYVVWVEADNELLLDLSHPTCIHILMDKLSKGDIQLQESLFPEYRSPATDQQGRHYANEIVIPLLHNRYRQEHVSSPPLSGRLKRIFPLGSEWVYAKIYCGYRSAEELLQHTIPLVIQNLKEQHKLKKWFFVRYNDPHHHIRLRIEGNSAQDTAAIIQAIQDKLASKLYKLQIANIQFDTYIREIERYGPEYMESSEALFYEDSEFVLHIAQQNPRNMDRWVWGMIGMESLLDNSGYTLSEKQDFAENMRSLFAKEFGNSKSMDRRFQQQFRDKKHLIESVLSKTETNTWLEKRAATITKIISDLETSQPLRNQEDQKKVLISSHIHMFVNRLFPFEQRMSEFALYHLLSNYYRMIRGKQKCVLAS